MTRPGSTRGWGLVVVLLSMAIVGLLWAKQAGVLLGPGRQSTGGQAGVGLPDRAREQGFNLVAIQVKIAVTTYESMRGQKPGRYEDLAAFGLDMGMKDPWGGRYYIKDGWLRCTGNPKAAEQLW